MLCVCSSFALPLLLWSFAIAVDVDVAFAVVVVVVGGSIVVVVVVVAVVVVVDDVVVVVDESMQMNSSR